MCIGNIAAAHPSQGVSKDILAAHQCDNTLGKSTKISQSKYFSVCDDATGVTAPHWLLPPHRPSAEMVYATQHSCV